MAKRHTNIDEARLAALRGTRDMPADATQTEEKQTEQAEPAGQAEEQTAYMPPPMYGPPAPKEYMVRVQHYLRPDQIKWLDRMAKRTGRGVTRSDYIRYAVDELRRRLGE